jgi:hypothetical protein
MADQTVKNFPIKKANIFLVMALISILFSIGCQSAGFIAYKHIMDKKEKPHPSLLVAAILNKDPGTASQLIKNGCDVNQLSDTFHDSIFDRQTPLYVAIMEYDQGHCCHDNWTPDPRLESCIESIIAGGANLKKWKGCFFGSEVPLITSFTMIQPFTLEALCRHGANPNAKDSFRRAALNYLNDFSYDGQRVSQCVDILLRYGADINSTDGDKQTPLLKASYSLKSDVIEFLLNRGAKYYYRDKYQRLPVDAAQFSIEQLKIESKWNKEFEQQASRAIALLENARDRQTGEMQNVTQ